MSQSRLWEIYDNSERIVTAFGLTNEVCCRFLYNWKLNEMQDSLVAKLLYFSLPCNGNKDCISDCYMKTLQNPQKEVYSNCTWYPCSSRKILFRSINGTSLPLLICVKRKHVQFIKSTGDFLFWSSALHQPQLNCLISKIAEKKPEPAKEQMGLKAGSRLGDARTGNASVFCFLTPCYSIPSRKKKTSTPAFHKELKK